jgi:hypothetical protein
MEVHIGEMNSTVRLTDTQALLNPQVLEQIVQVVLARLCQEQAHAGRVEDERRLRPAVSARETSAWE